MFPPVHYSDFYQLAGSTPRPEDVRPTTPFAATELVVSRSTHAAYVYIFSLVCTLCHSAVPVS